MTAEDVIIEALATAWVRQESALKPFHVMEERQKNLFREYMRDFIKTVDAAGFMITPKDVMRRPVDDRAAVCEWTKIDESWAIPGCMPNHRASWGGFGCFKCGKRVTWKKTSYISDGDEGPSIHQTHKETENNG